MLRRQSWLLLLLPLPLPLEDGRGEEVVEFPGRGTVLPPLPEGVLDRSIVEFDGRDTLLLPLLPCPGR